MVIDGLKLFLKNKSVTSDRQMLSVIFNLVNKVMGNLEIFEEQISLMNQVNEYIINVQRLEDEHLQKIIKINTILHESYKEKYETSAEPEFINFLIKQIASKSKSHEMTEAMIAFISSMNKIKTKPFEILDQPAEMMISQNIFDVKTKLNLIKNFSKMPSNLPIFLRNKLLTFLMQCLVSEDAVVRQRSLDIVKTLIETIGKKPDVKASLRENSMRFPESKIFQFLIQTLETNRAMGMEYDECLLSFLKIISLQRTLKDFQEIFTEVQNVEGFIKNISEKSPNLELRKLFIVIYEQMSNNWTTDQRNDILENNSARKKNENDGGDEEMEGKEEEEDADINDGEKSPTRS